MTIVGSAYYAIRAQPISYNPATGKAYGVLYEGPRQFLEAIIPTLDTAYPYRLDDSQAPLCRLEVHTPDAGDVATTWELVGNNIQKSIFEHPRTLALSYSDIELLRDKTTSERIANITSLSSLDARWLADILIRDTDSYTEDQFVFRITQIVPRNSVAVIALNNSQDIYSTSQIIAETGPGAVLLTALATIDSTPIAVTAGYAYGWKKSAASFQQVGYNRFATTIDYVQSVWSMYLYDLSNTAGGAAPNIPFE